MQLLSMPNDEIRLGGALINGLGDERFTNFEAAVAFAKNSGVKHIKESLAGFLNRGGKVLMTIGIDQRGTTKEALEQLLGMLSGDSELRIYHNENQSTFHTKVYLLYGELAALLFVGSSNLTEGGLFTNYEVDVFAELDLTSDSDLALFERAREILQGYVTDQSGLSQILTNDLLNRLVADGQVPTEAALAQERQTARESAVSNDEEAATDEEVEPAFPRVKVPSAPRRVAARAAEEEAYTAAQNEGFVMTLMQTDAGRGQTTPGTTPRSPEVFVPLAARDFNKPFWGWPDAFVEDPGRAGKMDRTSVVFRMGGRDIQVNMMTWPDKSDFRLRSRELIEEMRVGDILRIERVTGEAFSYYAEIIPQGTSLYSQYEALCSNAVRNSEKRWGYY